MRLRNAILLGSNFTYPVWIRVLEIAGIFAYAFVFYALVSEMILASTNQEDLLGVWMLTSSVLVFTVAYLTADLVSGIVHCLADNFGSPKTFFFGPAFIRPFRDHHSDPQGITHHDFVEANGNSCFVCLLVMVPTLFLIPAANYLGFLWYVFILMFTLMIVFTNQFHKWAHLEQKPWYVSVLQASGLVLRSEVHKVHHTIPFDRFYCITSGLLNPILDRIKFFEAFSRVASWFLPRGQV